ncbi:MAG: hypothetical protein QW508_06505 [Conexivisphaerales archaeon]
MTYRTVQGITKSLSEYFKPMQEVHFTQIRMLSMVRKRKLGPITATKKGDDKEGPTTIVNSAYPPQRRAHK